MITSVHQSVELYTCGPEELICLTKNKQLIITPAHSGITGYMYVKLPTWGWSYFEYGKLGKYSSKKTNSTG